MRYIAVCYKRGERVFSSASPFILAKEIKEYAINRGMEERRIPIKEIEDKIRRGGPISENMQIMKLRKGSINEINSMILENSSKRRQKSVAHELAMLHKGEYERFKKEFSP